MRAATGYAATGITNDADGDLIIDQYLDSNLTADDVIAAYGQNWIHGREIRRNPAGNAREVTHDGGNT